LCTLIIFGRQFATPLAIEDRFQPGERIAGKLMIVITGGTFLVTNGGVSFYGDAQCRISRLRSDMGAARLGVSIMVEGHV